MVDTNLLKSKMVLNGKTGEDVAKLLGMTPKTFYTRMKKGWFGTDEIEKMIEYLNLDDPMSIFFAKAVNCEDTLGGSNG